MRALLSIALLLQLILVAGCSHSGDFGAFIVMQVTKNGGHAKTVGVIPQLNARWTVKQGAHGFTAHISDVPFSAVDEFMEEVYGAPNISVDPQDNGDQRRVWETGNIGVTIQLIGHTNEMEIVCVRGAP